MEAGKGYPVDTSGGQITMTLPASASLGDTIEINDYKRTFGSNKCIINLNGHKMAGGGFNADVDVSGSAITLVYADSTQGWMIQQDDDPPLRSAGPPGNQSFTSAGVSTFTVPSGVTSVSVVCVGAGGKSGIGNSGQAGGGGALAYKNNITVTPGSTASVTVGAVGNHSGNNGNAGGLSKFTYGGVDYAIAGGGGGGNGNGESGGNPGAGGQPSGSYDGGGNGGNGGQDSQNYGGPGGGGAGGYSGNGGNGATSQANGTGAVSGQAGTGGAGGGGGKGGQSEAGGGGGGGVGLFGQGMSGNGGGGQGQNTTGGTGGNGGSNGNSGGSGGNQGNHAGGSGGSYGGGHGGPQSSQSAGNPGGGAVRVIWGMGRSFPNNASQA